MAVTKKSRREAAEPVSRLPSPGILVVRAARDGYRRAGRAWTVVEQTVPASEFTEEQRAALFADPCLVVKETSC
jgi:hypothetical protein